LVIVVPKVRRPYCLLAWFEESIAGGGQFHGEIFEVEDDSGSRLILSPGWVLDVSKQFIEVIHLPETKMYVVYSLTQFNKDPSRKIITTSRPLHTTLTRFVREVSGDVIVNINRLIIEMNEEVLQLRRGMYEVVVVLYSMFRKHMRELIDRLLDLFKKDADITKVTGILRATDEVLSKMAVAVEEPRNVIARATSAIDEFYKTASRFLNVPVEELKKYSIVEVTRMMSERARKLMTPPAQVRKGEKE